MASLPKKVKDRFSKTVSKFQKILQIAKDKDISESDTVAIVGDIFAEVFGYDKYLELTSEFAIRRTFCDLAVKVNKKVQFLVEVKAVGIHLKETHLRQAIEYGANHGIPWIILTNGIDWKLYKIRFEKPINYDQVCSFDFFNIKPRAEKDQETLFIISKEGVKKDARDDFYEKVQSVNRFVIAGIILDDVVLNTVRRELRRLSPRIKVDTSEIETLLRNEVLKRDVLDGEEAQRAHAHVKRFRKKRASTVKVRKNGKTETKKKKVKPLSFSD